MTELDDNLPRFGTGTREFWQACAEHRLLVQRCSRCRTWRWPPRGVCGECYSWESQWEEVSGDGVVATYAVVHRSFDPTFSERPPYIVALVDLADVDHQCLMLSNVVRCAPEEVCVGTRVRLVFERLASGMSVPKFTPANP